jgi:hypothetical protein
MLKLYGVHDVLKRGTEGLYAMFSVWICRGHCPGALVRETEVHVSPLVLFRFEYTRGLNKDTGALVYTMYVWQVITLIDSISPQISGPIVSGISQASDPALPKLKISTFKFTR